MVNRILLAASVVLLCGGCSDFTKLRAKACANTPGCADGGGTMPGTDGGADAGTLDGGTDAGTLDTDGGTDAGTPGTDGGTDGGVDAGSAVDAGPWVVRLAFALTAAGLSDQISPSTIATLGSGAVAVAGVVVGRVADAGQIFARETAFAARFRTDGGFTFWPFDAGLPAAGLYIAPTPDGGAIMAVVQGSFGTTGFDQQEATSWLVSTSFTGPPAAISRFHADSGTLASGEFGFTFTSLDSISDATMGLGQYLIATGNFLPRGAFNSLGDLDLPEAFPNGATFVADIGTTGGVISTALAFVYSCQDGGTVSLGPANVSSGELLPMLDFPDHCRNLYTLGREKVGGLIFDGGDGVVWDAGVIVSTLGGNHEYVRPARDLLARDPARNVEWVALGPAGYGGVSRLDMAATPPAGRLDVGWGNLGTNGQIASMAVDPATGTLYALGSFATSMTFAGKTVMPTGLVSTFLVKVSAAGAPLDVLTLGDSSCAVSPSSVTVDSSGVWLAFVYFNGPLLIDGRTLADQGGVNAGILLVAP